MKQFLLLFIFFSTSVFAKNIEGEKQLVNDISSLIGNYPDSAILLAQDFKISSEKKNSLYGIVQANYIIGYIYDEKFEEYGKAIIYYLEGIRYAEKSSDIELKESLISLLKNCGVIFRKFKSYELAKEYYLKGIQHASLLDDQKQILSINYNLAGVYIDEKNYTEAINIIENSLASINENSTKYYSLKNRLAIAFFKSGLYKNAIEVHNQMIEKLGNTESKHLGFSYHNLAKVYKKTNLLDSSQFFYEKAIEFKSVNHPESLFSSYIGYANTLEEKGNYIIAERYYEKALEIIPKNSDPEDFEMIKDYADLEYSLNNYEISKSLNDSYMNHLNNYIKLQEEIQETDKRYNMDLITKRYFDEVSKQERIASILFYSRLISGSLLMLLLISIGYNRYEKLRVRKTIEKQLLLFETLD